MAIYWILLSFSVLLFPICKLITNRVKKVQDLTPVENREIKAYFILVSLAMIFVIGCRGLFVGRDTLNYYFTYVRLQDVSALKVLFSDATEKGYVFFNILGHRLHLGFAGFNILYATVNISIISYLIYKKSPMPWLSYFIYICFEFFILDLTMMRQTLAMSIVALAMTLDKNETVWDFLKFVVCVFIAQTFHESAIIALPLWFLKKLPMDNYIIFVFLFLIGIAYLMRDSMAMLMDDTAGMISERYTRYGELKEGTAGMRLYLMVLVTVALGMFLRRYRRIEGNRWPFYSLCIMLMLLPALQGGGVAMRMYFYYYIFIIIYVPNLVAALDPKKDLFIKILIVVLYLIVGIYFFNSSLGERSLAGESYKFFWQPLFD